MNRTCCLLLAFCIPTIAVAQAPPEAIALRDFEARESHRQAFSPDAPSKFKPTDHVFVTSALALDFTYRMANVTLPLFRGQSSQGDVYYILTDASDFQFAHALGLNYAPKLKKAAGTAGAQTATFNNGLIIFKGNVEVLNQPVYTMVEFNHAFFDEVISHPCTR